MNTAGLSTWLEGKLQVYDAAGNLLGTATATDPLNGDLSLQVGGGLADATPWRIHLLRPGVEQQQRLRRRLVQPDRFVEALQRLDPGAARQPAVDHGRPHALGGDATDVGPGQRAKAGRPVRLHRQGQYQQRHDVDYYKVIAPSATGQKMNVLVWPLPSSNLLPRVDVYDASGNALRLTLLANENGTFSVEVRTSRRPASYYVKV